MIHFIEETLTLLPLLFVTYLVMEAVEAKAGGALEGFFGRARSLGPLVGACAGAVPQCGISAAVSSLYAGGVVSLGTLLAVFLSTSDELLPILISKQLPPEFLIKVVSIKCIGAFFAGFIVDAFLRFNAQKVEQNSVHELCSHSRCNCHKHKGIFLPALIHTLEIFLFIVVVSGVVELCMHIWGEECLSKLNLTKPFIGELVGGFLGLIPNCAISVASAELYCKGAISAGAMMASSFTGAGIGLAVLFRLNRSMKENLIITLILLFVGVILGFLAGKFVI
ncbi:MAG: arsenic efflux protein [Kiritimatiellae bacterium]|nr:arsenic efflux protein [Kiritimatiellia bacterium]